MTSPYPWPRSRRAPGSRASRGIAPGVLAGVLCLGMACGATAAGGTGTASAVASIRHLDSGDTLVRFGGAHNNPDGCDVSDQVLVTSDDLNRRHMLAAAAMAKATSGTLAGWLTGCAVIDGVTYPRARTLLWRD